MDENCPGNKPQKGDHNLGRHAKAEILPGVLEAGAALVIHSDSAPLKHFCCIL